MYDLLLYSMLMKEAEEAAKEGLKGPLGRILQGIYSLEPPKKGLLPPDEMLDAIRYMIAGRKAPLYAATGALAAAPIGLIAQAIANRRAASAASSGLLARLGRRAVRRGGLGRAALIAALIGGTLGGTIPLTYALGKDILS